MHMHEVRLKSAVVNKNNEPPSIYRLQPSPDVDAAWLYLTHHGRNFLITADEVRGLGKDPKGVTHLPDELGAESKPSLHCLPALDVLLLLSFADDFVLPLLPSKNLNIAMFQYSSVQLLILTEGYTHRKLGSANFKPGIRYDA